MDDGVVGAAARQLQQAERRGCKILNQVEAGSAGELESGCEVGAAIRVVAEYGLNPAQCYQREGRQNLPGLGRELG